MKVSMNGGMRMPSWYDIVGLDERSAESCTGDRVLKFVTKSIQFSYYNTYNILGIEDSVALVRELIDTEISAGLPPNRIVLAGFSQGEQILYKANIKYSFHSSLKNSSRRGPIFVHWAAASSRN